MKKPATKAPAKVYVLTWEMRDEDGNDVTVHATLAGAKALAVKWAGMIDEFYAGRPLTWRAARNVWHADVEMDFFSIRRVSVLR